MGAGIIYYVYVDWKRLQVLSKWLKQSSLCPVVLANLGNQTVLYLFAMCRLNYNHFQTGGITTESWSQSVRGTRCLRNTTGTQTYCSSPQNGHSKLTKSRFRNFKVVLNSTLTTDFLLIEWSQCAWLSTFIKATDFHYSYFRYLDYPAQSLPVQKTDSALFE